MASHDELYAKFGATAEAAQLLETDLGTMLLALEGWKNGWHLTPEPKTAGEFYSKLNRKTLGQLLEGVRRHINLDEGVSHCFEDGLSARNRLNHGFFERHNFAIQTDEGRKRMIDDLEKLHVQLFNAWQVAQKVVVLLTDSLDLGRPN